MFILDIYFSLVNFLEHQTSTLMFRFIFLKVSPANGSSNLKLLKIYIIFMVIVIKISVITPYIMDKMV